MCIHVWKSIPNFCTVGTSLQCKLFISVAAISQDSSNRHVLPQRNRQGKGCHALPTISQLLSDKRNWFLIKSSQDYHFPGVFTSSFPQRLGYCDDITSLPNHTSSSNPDFIYYDIQLGKDKARARRQIELEVNGTNENLIYMITPCRGVKYCGAHEDGCRYVMSTQAKQPCIDHPDFPLVNSHDIEHCPVEFVYIRPADKSDNRRWLTGIIRGTSNDSSNLHNHNIHASVQIVFSRVKHEYASVSVKNPHLKTRDVALGKAITVSIQVLL